DDPLALDRGHWLRETILAHEIFEVKPNGRVELAGQFRGGAGHGKITQEVREPVGVAVEPVKLAAVNGGQDAVLPRDLRVQQRLGNRRLAAEQDRVAVNALP